MKKTEYRFIAKILPKSGKFCVAVMNMSNGKRVMTHHWFVLKIDAVRFLRGIEAEGAQAFMAQASFKKEGTESSGRKQENAASLRNFFLDIDCGPGKPYASQADGRKALLSFCEKTGLPIPAVVSSGNGLYAHWPLVSQVEASRWMAEAQKLKRIVAAVEPGLDNDGIAADSARVLRLIGTTNRKDPANSKKVKLLSDCEPSKFGAFARILDKAILSLPPTLPTSVPSASVDSPVKHSVEGGVKIAKAIKIAKECRAIGKIKDSKGDVSEPMWYAGIGVLRYCEDHKTIIHKWSKGHPSYSRRETDDKIAQHKMPPTTCKHFSEVYPNICKKCKHNGKIKSPIVLGIPTIPDYIIELNENHFVSRSGGKTVVCREAYDYELKRFKLEMSSFADFKNFYCNRKVKIGRGKNAPAVKMPLGKAWLENTYHRQYEDIRLTPEGDVEGVYNLWRGFAVTPAKGGWVLMKEHIFSVICNSDKVVFRYVLRWLARMIQQPWSRGEVALVLQGKKGLGKGMLVNTLCDIMGQHSMSIYNGKHLTGNFNAHLEDCILLYVDEAFWAGDKGGESVLKGLITEPTIPIERKGYDLKPVRNLLHIIMASNNDWVVPASMDERRYCVLSVSEIHYEDFEYFTALKHEIDNGGREAMLHYLQRMDISDFNVRIMPKTEALVDQKLQSLDTVMAWWYQKLQGGELLEGEGWSIVPVQALYDDYVHWVQKQGGNIRRVTDTKFGMDLRKVLPESWPKTSRQKSKHFSARGKHYEFPNLKLCRKQFEKVMGTDGLKWQPKE